MDAANIYIIDQWDDISKFCNWTKYVCFQKLENNNFQLSIRSYQILNELKHYYCEKSDLYRMPNEIDGYPVVRVDGEYVVGGPLLNDRDDIWPIEFTKIDDPSVVEWLIALDKYDDQLLDDITALMTQS